MLQEVGRYEGFKETVVVMESGDVLLLGLRVSMFPARSQDAREAREILLNDYPNHVRFLDPEVLRARWNKLGR